MKTIKNTFPALILIFLISTFIVSCEKDETTGFVQKAELSAKHLSADLDAVYLFSVFHRTIHDTALINRDTAIIDSAMVTRNFDNNTGTTSYLINYADGVVAPDFKNKSGQIVCSLDMDFGLENATFTGNFTNLNINGTNYQGEMLYKNTGQFIGGKQKLLLSGTLTAQYNEQETLEIMLDKEILWVDGLDEAQNFDNHEFEISGTASGNYASPNNSGLSEATIDMDIDEVWMIKLSCHKLVRQGSISLDFNANNIVEIITGTFIDSDLDACSDKVMLKNSDNFGFPLYL